MTVTCDKENCEYNEDGVCEAIELEIGVDDNGVAVCCVYHKEKP